MIRGNAHYQMTMMASKKEYLEILHQNVYSKFSAGRLRPYPNPLLPQHIGKEVTQYHFETKTSLVFTCLHQLWYNWDSDLSKFVKRIPLPCGALPLKGRGLYRRNVFNSIFSTLDNGRRLFL